MGVGEFIKSGICKGPPEILQRTEKYPRKVTLLALRFTTYIFGVTRIRVIQVSVSEGEAPGGTPLISVPPAEHMFGGVIFLTEVQVE